MNATVDPDLVKTVEQHLISLKNDVDKQAFEKEEERQQLQTALLFIITAVEEVKSRVSKVEEDQRSLTAAVKITQTQIGELESQQEDVNAQVFRLGETLDTRVSVVEQEQLTIKENQNALCERFDSTQDQISKLQSDQEDMERHIAYLGDSYGNVSFSFYLALVENTSLNVLKFITRANLLMQLIFRLRSP